VGTVADECAAYCRKQVGLCPQSLPASDCTTSCVGIAQAHPACETDWATLNHCLSIDQPACDSRGMPSTTGCLYYTSSFDMCTFVTETDAG
jgi:hypothetical protein